ncbi:MAG TPA: MFS transporter [Rheinheimera sp.]|uniref:thiamine pyrophosphate-dependent enzyme n=1 Tax=Rheinheimera sp. TaxID=1869214 RepID=UPI000EC6B879|nr:thiamine pyrophosphate-dependent enzyme [Rheinheimera sp.]HCU66259.1 MFS transporter [Rheinheimera sp.]
MAPYEQHAWTTAYLEKIQHHKLPTPKSDALLLTDFEICRYFDSMLSSRLLDLRSRLLQAKGQSFYTIGSSGHEANAVVASALQVTDPAFLHYRSGAFFIERSKQLPGSTPIYDLLLSFTASSEDPISGGRHKVLGSLALSIPPQTSTIASHLPKAVGTAFAIDLSKRLDLKGQWPENAIAFCSFGDASANHSTAQGAINAACWADYQHVPVPVLFLCEDNGLGISTPTPCGWIAHSLSPHMQTFTADSRDLADVAQAARAAVDFVRKNRRPALLHLKTYRLFGHAGADAEVAYRKKQQIETELDEDPLLYATALLLKRGIYTRAELAELVLKLDQQTARVASVASNKPKLTTAEAVMQSIVPKASATTAATAIAPALSVPANTLDFDKHNLGKPQHLAKIINWTLHQAMARYPNAIVLGEDVGKKGGVYNVTSQLVQQFGSNRVINTLLDEQSILGLGIGLAQQGFLPVPEIQFLAYVHNAEDQIRGEAATLPFFSNGQYQNPMVVRIAGLAYQRGFGGHFHNDNSFAVFRDIPGLLLFCPSNGRDASLLLRQALALAHNEKRLVIFLEPIALYMTRDLHQPGDNLWACDLPSLEEQLPEIGTPAIRAHHLDKATDLVILSYANGFYLSCQAQHQLAAQGIAATVLDLRYLVPLHIEKIAKAIGQTQKVLIVDECRRRGSLSEELFTALHEHKPNWYQLSRLCAQDSFIPLGSAAYTVLPSVAQIIEQSLMLLGKSQHKLEQVG